MKWITREKVKVDRVACPWLIKKFVDPQGELIFVPGDQVETKARELGATPFDIDGCELGHHGEDVSFNSILKKHKLTDAALGLVGELVQAADGSQIFSPGVKHWTLEHHASRNPPAFPGVDQSPANHPPLTGAKLSTSDIRLEKPLD